MMSSEEETDCFALYGAATDSKQQQLLKKQKRTRQRVDAGEPRNSYSSIPNFSSRPSFLGGASLYGAVFNPNQPPQQSQRQSPTGQQQAHSPPQQQQQQQQQQQSHPNQLQQQPGATTGTSQGQLAQAAGATTTGTTTTTASQQHAAAFGFFGAPGYGPPTKMLNELFGRQVKQAADATGASPPEATTGMTGATAMDVTQATNPLQAGAMVNCVDDPATAPELTQHMLREILQGRKLSALSVQDQPTNNNSIHNSNSMHNNNSIHNNNNNNTTQELLKQQQQQQQQQQQRGDASPQHLSSSDSSARNSANAVQSGGEDSADGHNGNAPSQNGEREPVMPADADDSAEDAARAMEEAFAEAGMEPGANLDGSDCDQSLPSSPTGPRSGSVSVKEEMQDPMKRSPSHSPCPVLPKQESNSSPTTEIKRARVENIVSTMRSSPALQPATVNGCKKRKLYHPQQQHVHHVPHHSHVVNDVAMLDDDEESDEEEDYATIRQKREEKDNLKNQLNRLYEQVAVMQQKYAELSSRMGPESSESCDAPTSPAQLPPHRSHRALPAQVPYNGALPGSMPHDHAAAAAMYQKFYLEQERYAERMKQQQQQHHQETLSIRQQQQLQAQQQRNSSPQPSPQTPARQDPPSAPPTPRVQKSLQPPVRDRCVDRSERKDHDFQESLSALRGAVEVASSTLPNITGADLEGLADSLKTEISSYLNNLIDSIISRFVQQKKSLGKQSEACQAAADQLSSLNKDLMLASQYLERKSPRTKVVDRGAAPTPTSGPNGPRGPLNGGPPTSSQAPSFSPIGALGSAAGAGPHSTHGAAGLAENNLNQLNQLPPHARPGSGLFQTPKPPSIYAMASIQQQQQQQAQQREQQQREREQQQREQREQRERDQYLRASEERDSRDSEQNEALSLVMTPKKKRHKVTDTRITPRTVSRILAQDGSSSQGGAESPPPPPPPPPRPYHAPPMLPVSLPTSVAIPNPSLHESQVFSPYSPFFNPHAGHAAQVPPPGSHHLSASPPVGGGVELRDSPPLPHPPSMLHPALLAAAQHAQPDYGHLRMDSNDRGSDCNSGEISYDGIQPTSSTLTPMHLRKAKLMFFWVRYPSSAVLKMYFPDIKFNKNNTAQLVKWFSNFREFYYIQMEKYARQAVSEGVKSVEDLQVGGDSEIYRVLNLHYNRNNHIEVPSNFRYVVEQTLKEFFKAIQGGKDSEQSWKKSIYKVISRLDDPVPEYFKSPNFLEQLE